MTQYKEIQLARGKEEKILSHQLKEGEPAFAIDTGKLFVGYKGGKIDIGKGEQGIQGEQGLQGEKGTGLYDDTNVMSQLANNTTQIQANYAKVPMASKIFGYIIGWGGDSITNGSNSTNASVYSFKAMVRKILGYRVSPLSVNGGVPGERSDQLLARIDGIIAQGVQVLAIMIGTNDASQAVPLATYQANIMAIKSKADTAKIPMIISLIPPRGASAGADALKYTNIYNTWLRFYCVFNGIPCVDTYSALVDNTTGLYSSLYNSGDDTHPNNAGHLEIAKAVSKVLDTLLPKIPWLVTAKGNGLNSDPLMVATGGLISVGGAGTSRTIVANDGSLPVGNWHHMLIDNSAGGSVITWTTGIGMDLTKYVVGDTLLVCLYVKASVPIKIVTLNGAVNLSVPFDSIPANTILPLIFKVVVPTTTGNFRAGVVLTADIGATVTCDVGACDVFNLTTYGLSDIVI